METEDTREHVVYTSLDLEGQAAVGRIAIWAAYVELHTSILCNYLISDTYEKAEAVTRNMTASGMLKLARELVQISVNMVPEDSAKILDLLARSQAALQERNKIIHGSVGGTMDPTIDRRSAAFYSRKDSKALILTNENLDELGMRLHSLVDELMFASGLAYAASRTKP